MPVIKRSKVGIRPLNKQTNANNIMNQSNVRVRHPIGVAEAREKRPTVK